jgi:hypothetical protein
MKKQHVVLPCLLLVSTLAACGNSLSKDQAVAAAKKIQAYHNASDFAYKQDKVTFTMSGSENGVSTSTEVRIEKDKYYYVTLTTNTPATSSTAATKSAMTTYLFSKDGKYYSATDDGTTKSYSTMDILIFAASIKTLEEASYATIDGIAETAYATLDGFIKANDTSSSSKASSSSAATSAAATSDAQAITVTYTYASTGDGNLTITGNSVEDDSNAKMTGKEAVAFDNYYPVSFNADSNGTYTQSSSQVKSSNKQDVTFKWGTCTAIYPDLSSYSAK